MRVLSLHIHLSQLALLLLADPFFAYFAMIVWRFHIFPSPIRDQVCINFSLLSFLAFGGFLIKEFIDLTPSFSNQKSHVPL